MAINFPGPYELRFIYSSGNLTPGGNLVHTQRLNIDLATDPGAGNDFNDYVVRVGSGTNTALHVIVEDYLGIIDGIFNSGTTFDAVELWKYPNPQSFDAQFWSTYDPVINAGISASAAGVAGQDVYTFRTSEGGIFKLSFMENVVSPGLPLAYSAIGATKQSLVDFVLGGTGSYGAPFLGRDTSYPFAFIRNFPGQNERVFKKRYRPAT